MNGKIQKTEILKMEHQSAGILYGSANRPHHGFPSLMLKLLIYYHMDLLSSRRFFNQFIYFI